LVWAQLRKRFEKNWVASRLRLSKIDNMLTVQLK